jgi:hypothetical protein
VLAAPPLVEAGAPAATGPWLRSCAQAAVEAEAKLVRQARHWQVTGVPLPPPFLATRDFAQALWDNGIYSEQLFFFNTDARVRAYAHGCADMPRLGMTSGSAGRKRPRPSALALTAAAEPREGSVEVAAAPNAVGLDRCFDCAAEVAVLRALMLQVWPRFVVGDGSLSATGSGDSEGEAMLARAIRRVAGSISTAISPRSGRTLAMTVSPAAFQYPCHVSGCLGLEGALCLA